MFRKITLSVLATMLALLILALFVKPDFWGKTEKQQQYINLLNPDELVTTYGIIAEAQWAQRQESTIQIHFYHPTKERPNQYFHRINLNKKTYWLNQDQYGYYKLLNIHRFLSTIVLIPTVYFLFLRVYDNKETSTRISQQQRKGSTQALSEEERRELARARVQRNRSKRCARAQSKSRGRR